MGGIHAPAERSGELHRFVDRTQAGRLLGAALTRFRTDRPVILAIPRGGVPVATEVAKALDAEVDVLVVRKLGTPGQPELALGAVGESGAAVLNDAVLAASGVDEAKLATLEAAGRREVERRATAFRAGRPMVPVAGRLVIIVDDGIATGATARAAVDIVRAAGATTVVVAVPVASPATTAELVSKGASGLPGADEVVALLTPDDLWAVGAWYHDFRQVPDEIVASLLARARRHNRPGVPEMPPVPVSGTGTSTTRTEVSLPVDGVTLSATISVPPAARAWVVFAHGSGSSRTSPRNRVVAEHLQNEGFATVLVDLLDGSEAGRADLVFDTMRLARRLEAVVSWLSGATGSLPVSLFGASTGAAAALIVAAHRNDVFAVVSRGGRPDLVGPVLSFVHAPTLLIVGGADHAVLALNREAAKLLGGPVELVVIDGATHLFEERGALGKVSDAAARWFLNHLPPERRITNDDAAAPG